MEIMDARRFPLLFLWLYCRAFQRRKKSIPGNMAYIVAKEENGPRGHSELTLEERNDAIPKVV
jgi:hypothetical protein